MAASVKVERRPEWQYRDGWRVVGGGYVLAEFCVWAEIGLTADVCRAEAEAFADRLGTR